jgi:hypothetical protein
LGGNSTLAAVDLSSDNPSVNQLFDAGGEAAQIKCPP